MYTIVAGSEDVYSNGKQPFQVPGIYPCHYIMCACRVDPIISVQTHPKPQVGAYKMEVKSAK